MRREGSRVGALEFSAIAHSRPSDMSAPAERVCRSIATREGEPTAPLDDTDFVLSSATLWQPEQHSLELNVPPLDHRPLRARPPRRHTTADLITRPRFPRIAFYRLGLPNAVVLPSLI